jgi:hypothetical protein
VNQAPATMMAESGNGLSPAASTASLRAPDEITKSAMTRSQRRRGRSELPTQHLDPFDISGARRPPTLLHGAELNPLQHEEEREVRHAGDNEEERNLPLLTGQDGRVSEFFAPSALGTNKTTITP